MSESGCPESARRSGVAYVGSSASSCRRWQARSFDLWRAQNTHPGLAILHPEGLVGKCAHMFCMNRAQRGETEPYTGTTVSRNAPHGWRVNPNGGGWGSTTSTVRPNGFMCENLFGGIHMSLCAQCSGYMRAHEQRLIGNPGLYPEMPPAGEAFPRELRIGCRPTSARTNGRPAEQPHYINDRDPSGGPYVSSEVESTAGDLDEDG